MNQSSGRVLRYLAGDENIETVSVTDLQKLTEEHPYFPVSQFLLAKKLKAENEDSFLVQAQKTALYFSNPFWLHYQLYSELFSNENDLSRVAASTQLSSITNSSNNKESDEIAELLPGNDGEAESTVAAKQEVDQVLENAVNSKTESVNKSGESNSEEKSLSEEKADQAEEEMAALTRDTDVRTEQFLNEAVNEETFVHDTIEQVILKTQIPAALESTEVLEEMAGASRQNSEVSEAFLNEIREPAEKGVDPSLRQEEAPASEETQKDESTEQDEHERMFQNIKAMLDATSEEADADTENAVIPIDPYYTIDYFASQGIKLELDQNPKDELGQHLKKFTQWLKHMKKLGPEDATEVISRTETEADIQRIADSSNTVREVVTEAMASVLEKQGKKDKAIELYNKLSFLNPDKSAYFATKIKNLKGI